MITYKKLNVKYQLAHSLRKFIRTCFFCIFVMRLQIGPSRNSLRKLPRYSQKKSNLWTWQFVSRKSLSNFPACLITSSLISFWACSISSMLRLLRMVLNSLNSLASLCRSSSQSRVGAIPKIMCNTLLLVDLALLKACHRERATGLWAPKSEALGPIARWFLRRVIRCFWKLWKTDFFFPWSRVSSELRVDLSAPEVTMSTSIF